MEAEGFTTYTQKTIAAEQTALNCQLTYSGTQRIYLLSFDLKLLDKQLPYRLKDGKGHYGKAQSSVFRDSLCFYDPSYSFLEKADYLWCFAVNFEQGIEKGMVDAILKQVKLLAVEGEKRLAEFLQDDTVAEFSLAWPERSFYNTVKTLQTTGHYKKDVLHFDEEMKTDDKLA